MKTSQTTQYQMRYGPLEISSHNLSKPTIASQGREKCVSLLRLYIWGFELVTFTVTDRLLLVTMNYLELPRARIQYSTCG